MASSNADSSQERTFFAALQEGLSALENRACYNSQAAFELAVMNLLGLGLDRDAFTGTEWMRRAAELGHPAAQRFQNVAAGQRVLH